MNGWRRWLLCLIGVALLGGAIEGRAQSIPAPLADYKHVSWSLEEGAPSRINALTQSADGYLWIGSVEGLFRFDGISFERIRGASAPSEPMVVSQVLGARSGDVWVGLARSGGVAVYRKGRLQPAGMPNPSREVTDLAEDRDGAIWVARGGRVRDTLARYWRGRWTEIGADWNLPEQQIWQILFTRDGTMWVVFANTVMRLPPGARRFEPTGAVTGRRASLAEDRDGHVWLSDSIGTRLLPQPGETRPAARIPAAFVHPSEVGGTRLLFDRNNDLWATTWTDGLFQIDHLSSDAARRAGRVATFRASDGLTSDQTHALLEDREGNIWVGTELGLDMLRPAAVIAEPAIPANSPRGYRMAVVADGTVYIADSTTLYRIAPRGQPEPVLRGQDAAGSLCAARDDGVWVMLRDRILHVGHGATRSIPKPPTISSYGCAEDSAGRLWVAGLEKGLYWYQDSVWHSWPGLTSAVGLPANMALDGSGRAVVLFRTPPPPGMSPPFVPLYRQRFAIGGLEGLLPARDAVYVSGSQGMARLAGDKTATVLAERYPWLASVNGLAQSDAGETWTIGDAGITRMRSGELAAAFRDAVRLPHQLFDFRDGLNSFAQKAPGPQVVAGGDGRIWFLTRRNVVFIDPTRLVPNAVAPPVWIRALTTDTAHYRDPGAVTVQAGTTNLTIDYTALSLSVPSRVRFRYRLDGVDRGWIDPGAARVARYTNLRPGTFRFQVIASNNNGVWNRTGATLTIEIPPTFFQTWLFRACCVIAGIALLWAIYSLRVRRVAGRMRKLLEERVSERERIARELHDTLLQGVQGLVMRFQSVADHIADTHPAKPVIDRALDRADQVLIEGRDRVRDLRAADSRILDTILEEVAREQPFAADTSVTVVAEGAMRDLQPLILDEIVRIAGEALFNAALHAEAQHVQVRILYSRKSLKVVFADDGKGIGAERLLRAGREGHFGVIGMHERARRIGAQLSLDSAPGQGTKIKVRVNASVAFVPLEKRWFGRRWSG